MPKRKFGSEEEFKAHVKEADELIFDGTEHECERPYGHDNQKVKYSGKQKDHTDLALVLTDKSTWIYYVSEWYDGSNVDYAVFKNEFPFEKDWFVDHRLIIDLGFTGIKKLYRAAQVMIGFKRPRKTKQNPEPELTEEQKKWNKEVSKNRIYVEHAIGKIKRFRILKNRCRLKRIDIKNRVLGVCAGMWNLKILLKAL